MAWEVKLHIYY